MDAFTFIESARAEEQPVYVLAGTERFLKGLALERIRRLVLGDEPDPVGLSSYDGGEATLGAVLEELETLPFLAARRLVVVKEADTFVTRYREALEKYAGHPSRSAVLVLDVVTWKSNTRLAKLVPDAATIVCEVPKEVQLVRWCMRWARSRHEKELGNPAATLLVELVGNEMGVLDQELAKLASFVGDRDEIRGEDVDALVGHSRVETAWKMLDAIADGQPASALTILQQLFEQGEEPMAILGATSWQLRRIAQVARLCEEGLPRHAAMNQLSIPPWARQRMEQFLEKLGGSAHRLYDCLLDASLGMRGSGPLAQLPPRLILERLVVTLATPVSRDRHGGP